jgi:hypothetical protein
LTGVDRGTSGVACRGGVVRSASRDMIGFVGVWGGVVGLLGQSLDSGML